MQDVEGSGIVGVVEETPPKRLLFITQREKSEGRFLLLAGSEPAAAVPPVAHVNDLCCVNMAA